MAEISINVDKCNKDGLCVMACTRAVFHQDAKNTVPMIEGQERCFSCGHCVSICPAGAISHSDYPKGTVHSIKSDNLPGYDQLLELVHSRRSIRLFKEKKVERDMIGKVLDAARFAPSGHNEQSTEFVVVQDQNTIREIAKLTTGYLSKLVQQIRNPIARIIMRRSLGQRSFDYVANLAPEMEHLVNLFNSGTDWIVRQPPVLVLFCADSAGGNFANVNANLALHNAALAAEALGLGCYYTGFVVIACGNDNSIARLLSLPETHKIYGALAMGYPRLKYRRWPERNPAKVSWVGFD
jgi:nitroreductase/NAD-dependent dihydropyrimidine dehydrogenase PreA subunit